MKMYVEICCNFEKGMKFDNYIQGKVIESKKRLEQYRPVLQIENKCLCLNGYYYYYQIKFASLPVTHSVYVYSGGRNFNLTITFSAQNNFISFSFNKNVIGVSLNSHLVLVDAAGHQLNLNCVVQLQDYICEQSINELKDMAYIVNDGFVLRIQPNCISSGVALQ